MSPAEREMLAAFAQVLIPGGAGLPGAGALALAHAPTDTVLRVEPSRIAPLKAFLDRPRPPATLAEVEAMAQADPEGFAVLSVVLANAYFMHPVTRAAIGYPGQEARDSSVGLTETDLALVAEVTARGPIWRRV